MMLDKYYALLSKQVNYLFVITLDSDDSSMNNTQVKERLDGYPNLHYHFGQNNTKIEAYNNDIDKHNFDILILASDDMEPYAQNYDLIIAKTMQEAFPDYDGVLNFSDGSYGGADLNTIPIIGKKYYDRFGYAFHPAYKSWWCDCEFTIISKLHNKEKVSNKILFVHRQYAFGMDQLYRKNAQNALADKKTYFERKNNLFGLEPAFINSLTGEQRLLFNICDGR